MKLDEFKMDSFEKAMLQYTQYGIRSIIVDPEVYFELKFLKDLFALRKLDDGYNTLHDEFILHTYYGPLRIQKDK